MWLSAVITKSSCFVTVPVTGQLQGNIFLKMLPKPTKRSRKSVILSGWILECGSLFVIYLGEIQAHWHHFFAVMKWQKQSNICKTYVFPSSCYIFIPRPGIYQCVQRCLCSSSARKDWMRTVSEASRVLYRQISPKNSFSEPQHTRHLLTVKQNACDHVPS